MSWTKLKMVDMVDGQEIEFPCGVKTITVTPKEPSGSYDLTYADGSGCFGLKIPFSYDYPQPIDSQKDNKLKVVAHGIVHLIYTT